MESVYEKIVVDLLDTRLAVVDSAFEYLINKKHGNAKDHRHVTLPSTWLMKECGSLWKEKVCEYFGTEKMIDVVNIHVFRKFHADTLSKVIENDAVFEEQMQQTWILPDHYVEWNNYNNNNNSFNVEIQPNYNENLPIDEEYIEQKEDKERVVKVWQDIVPWSKESIKGRGLETPPKRKKTKKRKKRSKKNLRNSSKQNEETKTKNGEISLNEAKNENGTLSFDTKNIELHATKQQLESWSRTSGLVQKDKQEWYDLIGRKSPVSTRATTPSFSIGLHDGPSAYVNQQANVTRNENINKQKETMKKNKEKLMKRVKGPIDKRRLHNLAIATM